MPMPWGSTGEGASASIGTGIWYFVVFCVVVIDIIVLSFFCEPCCYCCYSYWHGHVVCAYYTRGHFAMLVSRASIIVAATTVAKQGTIFVIVAAGATGAGDFRLGPV